MRMNIITIKKPDIDSFEMVGFRFGMTKGRVTRWRVHHGGIISKNVAPIIKQSFKEMMPFIYERYPEIPRPFSGEVEIDDTYGRSIKFITTTQP